MQAKIVTGKFSTVHTIAAQAPRKPLRLQRQSRPPPVPVLRTASCHPLACVACQVCPSHPCCTSDTRMGCALIQFALIASTDAHVIKFKTVIQLQELSNGFTESRVTSKNSSL